MPGFAFAPVGRLGLTSPPSRPLPRSSLLCSAKTTASPSQVASLCRSLPDTSLVPIQFVSLLARQRAGDSPLAPGPLVYRFAYFSGCSLTRRSRSSRVPRLPLCAHAPFSDSGGVLSACHIASRTRAFRQIKTVGFPQFSTGLSFRTTTNLFSELYNAACTLATPGFIHTLAGYARRFATDSVANLLWWDLSLFRSHPLGNYSQFHDFPVNPKTLNLLDTMIKQAGLKRSQAQGGAVTLIQRFGSVLRLELIDLQNAKQSQII